MYTAASHNSASSPDSTVIDGEAVVVLVEASGITKSVR